MLFSWLKQYERRRFESIGDKYQKMKARLSIYFSQSPLHAGRGKPIIPDNVFYVNPPQQLRAAADTRFY